MYYYQVLVTEYREVSAHVVRRARAEGFALEKSGANMKDVNVSLSLVVTMANLLALSSGCLCRLRA